MLMPSEEFTLSGASADLSLSSAPTVRRASQLARAEVELGLLSRSPASVARGLFAPAVRVDEEKLRRLNQLQALLAAKLVMGEASAFEKLQLRYVRWAINRMEVVKYSNELADAERGVEYLDSLRREVDALVVELREITGRVHS